MIKNKIIWFTLFYLFCGLYETTSAQDNNIISCKISYISKENIYVDKGKDSGLSIGDTLKVKREDKIIANLKILYVAEHSASCSVLFQNENLRIGDRAECLLKTELTKKSELTVEPTKRPAQEYSRKKESSKPFARVNGGLSLLWLRYKDQSGNNLNFDQPTIQFNLRAKELWGKKYYFIIKMRIRNDERTRSYSTGVKEKEWRNRIYSFYFSYEDEHAPINFRIGRILTPNLRGIGYLDGLYLQHNINQDLNWGVYAGLQSSWQFATSEDSLKKYGLFVSYKSGDFDSNRFTGTIAYNAVYHERTVSRENLYVQSSFNSNNRLSIYQSMEVDINSSWRKEKENQYISLTSFYLSARYKFSDVVRSGISYDNRKNFYRYETREIPEDFYDLAFRHGLSADLSLTFPQDYSTSIYIGAKKREGDSETTYVSRLSLKRRNFIYQFLDININLNRYINYYTKGWIPSITISKQIAGGTYLSLNGGFNTYKMQSDGQDRSHRWLRLNGNLQIFSKMYLSGFYSYEWGDDFKGYRMLAEIGYRL